MKKRLIAMAAALCLTLALMPVNVLAEVNNWQYWQYWGGTSNPQASELTEAEKQRAELERLIWYAWLSGKYAVMRFEDVPQDSWYYTGVRYVWQNSLMSGVSEDRFAPEELTNRAMAWTVLARIHKVDTKPGDNEAWYTRGVDWAVRNGLGDGTDPMGAVTREYLAEMLWRCANGPLTPADLSGFSDRDQVSAYAENAVNWAVTNNILQGMDGRLSPQGSVSRAELAEMVMRYKSVVHY